MSEFTNEQVDGIIKEIMPVLERTGMKASDTERFIISIMGRLNFNPESAMEPIRKVLRDIPLATFQAKKIVLYKACVKAAEELRLLIASDEHASAGE